MERIKKFDSFDINEREVPDVQGKILVILGAPGSGKGTLSKELKAKYNFEHISTGDLIRKSEDEEIKKIIDAGNFLPDDMMIKMLRKELKKIDPSSNIILDGFPRTTKQAKRLDALLGRMGLGLNHALFLELPEDVAKERIKKRAEEEDRKDDANEEVVDKRFQEYNEKTLPILDFYRKSRKLIRVNADKGKEDVLKHVVKRLSLKKVKK
jgi:adenylate kinase